MISRTGKKNFIVAHYDWLIAAIGFVAMIVGIICYVMTLGVSKDDEVREAEASVEQAKPSKNGVEAIDIGEYVRAAKSARNPTLISELPEKGENFLASERRLICKGCKKVISGNIKKFPTCPYCGAKQEAEQIVVIDADGDGMPDEWEKRYGLNMNDPSDAEKDSDNDGFTNFEEYKAKTNPTDAKDHPDYLDSISIQLPLKQTYLPFIFVNATEIIGRNDWRCEFFDASKVTEKAYGTRGLKITAQLGEDIANSGYILKACKRGEVMEEVPGGMPIRKEIFEATLSRKIDGFEFKLSCGDNLRKNLKAKPIAIDKQVTLIYNRGEIKTFNVVKGDELNLSGEKYKVLDVTDDNNKVKVTLENSLSGKKHVLDALEP